MRKIVVLMSAVLGLAAAVAASAETKSVQAYCALPEKKIVTNVVSVTINVDTSSGDHNRIAKSMSEKIGYKASETLYEMGINSDGAIYCTFSDPALSFYVNENKQIDYLRGRPADLVALGYRLVTVSGFGTDQAASAIPATAPAVKIDPARRIESIFFRTPSNDQNGFSGVVFDVEYQFIPCAGELHIAYSVVEGSVGVGRLAGGGDRLLTNGGRGEANYWHEGKVYKVGALPRSISSLPLKGIVWLAPDTTNVIGRFADDHAAKALGFGCFSGQTKKVADLKDLRTNSGQEPTKEEIAKLFEGLRVSFETVQVLTSSAAEEEIRSGLAKAAADQYERSGQAGVDRAAEERTASRKATADRATRKAAEEAEFQAKQNAYEEGVAAHKAALEQYQKAIADAQAQQASGVAQAKVAQEEFARKQAEYEAEAARARKAQEEYEAKYGSPQ